MTHRFADEEAVAQDLIRDFGTTCLILRRGTPGGDAFNPTPGAETSETCRAVLADYKGNQVDGTLVHAADRKALVSTEGVTVVPEPSDTFRIGTQDYKVISVKTLSPADVPVMWTLQLRA